MTDQLRNPSSSSSSSSSSPSSSLSSAPSLCVNHCGFFGNPKQDDLCSKCYKTIADRKQAAAAALVSSSDASSSLPSTPSSDSDVSPLAIPELTHSRLLTDELSPPTVDTQPEPLSSSVSLPLSIPSLSFSESLTIPLTSPQASPVFSSSIAESPALPLAELTLSPSPSPAPATLTLPSSPAEPSKKKKNRCSHCSKLVGLTYFACRCNEEAMFCVAHRYPHSHGCQFDHKAQQQTKLTKNNPLCAHEKLERI